MPTMNFDEIKADNRKNWVEMARITKPKCMECTLGIPGKYCCDRKFCDIIAGLHRDYNITGYDYRSEQELPFMRAGGCSVKPYHRPPCAAFVCPHHLDDVEFKAAYTNLSKKCWNTESPPIPGG